MSISKQSIRERFDRVNGVEIAAKNVHIQANNQSVNLNIFKFTGTVQIIEQFAEITEVTAGTNMTAVYADVYDGANSVSLTGNSDFSGLCAGSFFTKDSAAAQAYTIHLADEVRMSEPDRLRPGRPFLITAKYGVDNYIRFNFTTNTVLDFKMDVYFTYRLLNGATLELA